MPVTPADRETAERIVADSCGDWIPAAADDNGPNFYGLVDAIAAALAEQRERLTTQAVEAVAKIEHVALCLRADSKSAEASKVMMEVYDFCRRRIEELKGVNMVSKSIVNRFAAHLDIEPQEALHRLETWQALRDAVATLLHDPYGRCGEHALTVGRAALAAADRSTT